MNKISPDVLRKIREIEIYTRKVVSSSLIGDARSAQKGVGFEFDQLRDYQPGDDVRFIDWRASARMDKVLIKQYREERSRTIIIAVDVSGSSEFSSDELLRKDIFAQIGSMLALVAEYGKDRVGLLLFSDHIEKYIPPARGRTHTRILMEELFTHIATHKGTHVDGALQHLLTTGHKNSLVFVLSDFISAPFEKSLRAVTSTHEVVAVRYLDSNERQFPSVGFITVEDIETGNSYLLDTRKQAGVLLNSVLSERLKHQNTLFGKYGVDIVDVAGNNQFMSDMVRFFRRRMRY